MTLDATREIGEEFSVLFDHPPIRGRLATILSNRLQSFFGCKRTGDLHVELLSKLLLQQIFTHKLMFGDSTDLGRDGGRTGDEHISRTTKVAFSMFFNGNDAICLWFHITLLGRE